MNASKVIGLAMSCRSTRGCRSLGKTTIPLVVLGAIVGLGAAVAVWRGGWPDDASAAAWERQARLAIRAQRWDEAEAALERLSRTPDWVLLRAEVALGRGRPEEALRWVAEVSPSDPRAGRAWILAGQAELRASRLARAERRFLDALAVAGEGTAPEESLGIEVAARRGLIYVYGMQARRRELDEQFRKLAEVAGLSFHEMLVWTLALEDIWINTGVRADLERIVAADPEDRWSRLALAEVLLRAGELEASESVLADLPETDPEARVLRARLAWHRSDLEEAERLVAEGPDNNPDRQRLRGQLALRRGDLSRAVEAFRASLDRDPANVEALQGLALALRRQGKTEQADEVNRAAERHRALTAILELCRSEQNRADPSLPPRLAAACEAIGRLDLARGWYRAALATNPTDPAIQSALRRLQHAETESDPADGRSARDGSVGGSEGLTGPVRL
ncbi:MAG: hypothetical protein KatS3mg108_0913 [Isosphaeraceae bacterium]|jgi:tetratricopeptide (TPR) repeat protein|nr:MAG: hypothetical protein KatS3mg108_0913 [Isosphaeraceae bacterium]